MTAAKPIPIPQGRYLDRVVARLVKQIDWPDDPQGCWIWTGSLSTTGYGRTSVRRSGAAARQRDTTTKGDQRSVLVHRLTYALWNGDTDMPIDHMCETPTCVNPLHLRPLSMRENTLRSAVAPSAVNARRTRCQHGHPLYGDNLYVEPSGRRRCRACVARRGREWRERVDYGYNGVGTRGARRQGERRTHCVRGHPATPANTYYRKSGRVECRVCRRLARSG